MGRKKKAPKFDFYDEGRPRGRRAEHRATLTDDLVNSLAPTDREYTVRDFRVPQLGARVRPTGGRSYVVEYRAPRTNQQRRLTLGDCNSIDVDNARAQALAAVQKIILGEDPRTPAQERAKTVRDAYDLYAELVFPTFSRPWQAKVAGTFKKRILTRIGALPLNALTRADVRSVYEPLVHSHETAAVQTRRIVSAFLSWCVERDWLIANPIKGTKLPARLRSRDRVLNDPELADVWIAAGELGAPWTSFVKLLMLTGQRSRKCWKCTRARSMHRSACGKFLRAERRIARPTGSR